MTLRYAPLSSDPMQAAVRRLEQFPAKVPTNLTTPHISRTSNAAQLVENLGMGR